MKVAFKFLNETLHCLMHILVANIESYSKHHIHIHFAQAVVELARWFRIIISDTNYPN